MERRYYLLRVLVLAVAVVTVAWTSHLGTHRVAHALNEARYSAPAAIEHAVWNTLRDGLARLFRPKG